MGKGELWHPANQKPLNRSSPNLIHVIMSWVPITKQNFDAVRPGVSSPHIREIYMMFACLLSFFVLTYLTDRQNANSLRRVSSADAIRRLEKHGVTDGHTVSIVASQ